MLLNGTPDQKKKLIREYLTGESESSSGDEFEKEMEAELSSTMKTMEGTWGPTAAGNARSIYFQTDVGFFFFSLQTKFLSDETSYVP